MSKSIADKLAALGRDNVLTQAGEYWSQDNARFEGEDPTFLDRVGRSLNPMTGLGSAMGAMHDAAGQGSVSEMGLAALQALPAFGALKAVTIPAAGLKKAGTAMVGAPGKTAALALGGATASAAVDKAQAQDRVPANRQYEPAKDLVQVPEHLQGVAKGPEVPLDSKLQFEQRMLYPSKYPVLDDPEGGFMTHKMAWSEATPRKGGPQVAVAFPTVVYHNGKLKELDTEAAFKHAMQTGEYREFADPNEAALYSEGFYKKAWGKGDAVEALRARLRHEGKQ